VALSEHDAAIAARASDQAKSEHLSRISHELRTPLTAIIGYTELLQYDARDDQEKRLTSVMAASNHLLAVVERLLDAVRMDAGRIDFKAEPISLMAVSEQALELLRPKAMEQKISVLVDDSVEEISAFADPVRVVQVLTNLLSNALLYNQSGTTVRISAEKKGDRVKILVEDDGIGIPETQLDLIWEPFERVGTPAAPGAGLGLYMTKKIVQAMGGEVGTSTELGHGSTFWFTLPISTEPAPERARKKTQESIPPLPKDGRTLVLHVEDDIDTLHWLSDVFKLRPDIHLIQAENGNKALDLLSQQTPNLILLDLQVPDMGGEELLVRLRGAPATRDTPIIAFSAYSDPARIARVIELGASKYLTKPARLSQIWDAIDSLLAAAAKP
jgi:CheY-like chemotaxis protein